MHAEIIAIGDEITSGQTVDTNTAWLAARLTESGISPRFHTTVGDDLAANVEVFRHAIERADLIIATGGLGPTADDLTRDALAEVTDRPLVRNDEALDHIRGLFARRNRPMPESNELQALFPESSRMIANPEGTAPGIAIDVERPGKTPCRLYALPGVPAEMKTMFFDSIEPELRTLLPEARLIRHRRIHCFGAGESAIEESLPDLIRRGRRPQVGITASGGTITFRITADGQTEQECLDAMGPTVETIYATLGNLVFGEAEDQLQDVVLRLLDEKNATLATVEWATEGLLAHGLAVASANQPEKKSPEAQDPEPKSKPSGILGSVIVGQDAGLTALIDHESLSASADQATQETQEKSVREMALAVRTRFEADFGLAIGPLLDGSSTPSVFLALATDHGVETRKVPLMGHSAIRKIVAIKTALNLFRLKLLEEREAV